MYCIVCGPSNSRKSYFIKLLLENCEEIGTNMAEYLRSKESIEFPYILMLGDNQCFQAFTIINGAALQQSTLLAALDVCFKAFYIFDINYPKY
ncbi:uncharacterized protein LOC107707121 [Tachysurus ichikawai]